MNKKVFIYGGNLGKPQGIDYVISCLKTQKSNEQAFFVIVGEGSEYNKLEEYATTEKQNNLKLLKHLPKEDYDKLVGACDFGLIFLDHRFTIPNFPSRLLSYMQAKVPVVACTDANTDVGKTIVDGGFGWWCESNDVTGFYRIINSACTSDCSQMKQREFMYLQNEYSVEKVYERLFERERE